MARRNLWGDGIYRIRKTYDGDRLRKIVQRAEDCTLQPELEQQLSLCPRLVVNERMSIPVELDKATAEAFVLAQAGSFAVGLKTFCLSLAIRFEIDAWLCVKLGPAVLCLDERTPGSRLLTAKLWGREDLFDSTEVHFNEGLAITTCRGSDDISRYGKIAIGYWRTLFCDSHQFSANASPMYADASRALTRISQPAHFDLKFYGAKYLDATFAPVGLLGEGGKVSRVARQLRASKTATP
ncbi:hypothetical protein WG66_007285 [Moniliophthora roreri]|nr:hypothetical protein WG66_007285 [Moniliophthora roreri]